MNFSEILISIISLFIFPIISVGIYYKNKTRLNEKSVVMWAIFVAMVFLISKIIFTIVSIVFVLDNVVYSFQYCFVSLLVSLLAPFIYSFTTKRFKIDFAVIKNEKK